ncbi:MAG: heat-inducible transcriptional repressor HrcA [Acidimicrobiales bacterium]
MLDDRKAAILQAVVQEYIATAQPVGSGRVASAPGVEVSSATVRSEMAALEDQGYLTQPHTSAGRVPTDKGYRVFVDHLRYRHPDLDPADRRQVRDFFATTGGELESMLARTSELLSRLTDWTAVVVAPSSEVATVRSAQLVDLSSHTVLVVAVLSNGVIEKRTVESVTELTSRIVADASAGLARAVVGRAVAELEPVAGLDGPDPLVDAAIAALREASQATGVFVGGASRLASAFAAVEQVSEVLAILEKQLVVVSLIRDVLDRGMRVAIGEETGVVPLSECSLVVAPYTVEHETAGTIGILGPTRMDYSQALSAVAVVSKRLGAALSED